MAPGAKGAIHRDVACAGTKTAEDFVHHDWKMRARRRPAGRADSFHVGGVLLRIQFLVFVVKLARVFARIAPASGVHRWEIGGPFWHATFYSGMRPWAAS